MVTANYRERFDLSLQSFSQSFNETVNKSALYDSAVEAEDTINNLEKMLERLDLSDNNVEITSNHHKPASPALCENDSLPSGSGRLSSPYTPTPGSPCYSAEVLHSPKPTQHNKTSEPESSTSDTASYEICLPVSISLDKLSAKYSELSSPTTHDADNIDSKESSNKSKWWISFQCSVWVAFI